MKMTTSTDNTEFAMLVAEGDNVAGVTDLLEHLDAMGEYAIGIGDPNAAAASTAAVFIRTMIGHCEDELRASWKVSVKGPHTRHLIELVDRNAVDELNGEVDIVRKG